MPLKRILGIVVGLGAMLASLSAFADETSASKCSETYVRAQTLRNERRLMESREALRACALSGCKDFIVRDCVHWLDQVQTSLPTVVPVATDGAGNDLGRVRVSIDGKVLLETIDGRAIEVDPGPHTFLFEGPDAARVEKQVIVAEGEKGKRIATVLGNVSVPVASGDAGSRTRESPEHAETEMGPWKMTGLVTTGVGDVGAGIGAFFGLRAAARKSDANCDANSGCNTLEEFNTLSDAQRDGNLATIFLASGGILAAGGFTLFMLAPARPVRVAPSVGRGGLTMVFEGNW
jgi:hypothetical protein